MPLEIGVSLGPYQIVGALGAGGMGEVYRARDSRLGRDVALKVLHAGAFRDPDLRRRFIQEANAVGALNHPNIVAVFDADFEGEIPYIVAELVEGESLRKVVARGSVPVRRLLDISQQIADGMAAAHQASIVHRDLKPENILLNREGRVKIVDFGLAKSVAPASEADSENHVTVSLSALGVVMGTVDYMSPEQASGKRVDTRSDIFSFGLILFEMATGQRPFVARSKIETLEAIINRDTPPLPGDLPLPLKWCIERCLAKEPADRYNSTLDLSHDLRSIKDRLLGATEALTGPVPVRTTQGQRQGSRIRMVLITLSCVSVGILAVTLRLAPDGPDLAALRFIPLVTGPELADRPAWSPQGGIVAYNSIVDGHSQIFTKSLQSPTSTQVTHCAGNCDWPEWSGDGRQIFLRSGADILVVGAAGGEPKTVTREAEAYTLSPDGKTLAFLRRNKDLSGISLWTASPPIEPPKHYEPAPFEGVDTGTGLRLAFTPDGRNILMWARFFGRGSEFWMLPYPAGSGTPRRVLRSLDDAFPMRGFSWLPDGRQLILAAALPPDIYRSHLYLADLGSGSVRLLVGGVGSESVPVVSRDGKQVAYAAMEYDTNVVGVPLDGSAPRNIIATSRLEHSPVWSPRGREIAYVTDRSGADEIWVRNIETGREQPIVTPQSFPGGKIEFLTTPAFSPEGERLAFVRHNRTHPENRDATEIWISPVNGGTPVRLIDLKASQWAPTWSPEGNSIAFTAQGPPSGIMKVRLGGNEPPEMVWPLDIPIRNAVAEWSPKGDWIAIPGKEGTLLIDAVTKVKRVLRRPAFAATAWSRDGLTLYGLEQSDTGQRILAVNVDRGTEREVSAVPASFNLRPLWVPGLKMSVSADGKTLATTAVHQSGDIWLLLGFEKPSLWQRLFSPKH